MHETGGGAEEEAGLGDSHMHGVDAVAARQNPSFGLVQEEPSKNAEAEAAAAPQIDLPALRRL